MFSDILISI